MAVPAEVWWWCHELELLNCNDCCETSGLKRTFSASLQCRWAKEHNVDPYAKDAQEDDGLAFMTQHGEHGWHQQFGMESGSHTGKSDRTSFSGEIMFGEEQAPARHPLRLLHCVMKAQHV